MITQKEEFFLLALLKKKTHKEFQNLIDQIQDLDYSPSNNHTFLKEITTKNLIEVVTGDQPFTKYFQTTEQGKTELGKLETARKKIKSSY